MKALISMIRRAVAKTHVCTLELRLADQTVALRTAETQEAFLTIYMARAGTQKALAAARANYNSLLPIGERKTWGIA